MTQVVLCAVLWLYPMADTRPPLNDADWLPPTTELVRYQQAAWSYYCDLYRLSGNLPDGAMREQVLAARTEVYRLHQWYSVALDVRQREVTSGTRRDYLAELRDLAPELYFNRRLPPCVPVWRLARSRFP